MQRFKNVMAQRLRTEIELRKMPFGTTNTGMDWCVKALHPSDPLTEVRGIPDHSAVPSLVMNYQSTFTLSPATDATGTWSFNASLLPHPVCLMYTELHDSDAILEGNFLNPQIDGATHNEKYLNFLRLAQRWRLAYMSVTVIQDGPDLANQGTIVACQSPVAPELYPMCLNAGFTVPRCAKFGDSDKPNFDTSQAMPNAYFNRSREGAYVPLKLTETSQDWMSEADQITMLNVSYSGAGLASAVRVIGDHHVPQFPFYTLESVWSHTSPSFQFDGQATSPLLNGTIAHICARNLAVTTSFTFFVRMGLEMQVNPSSTLAPQLKLSPPYDRLALDTYFAIARELKDGFPAEYNEKGKIWDEISRALAVVGPALNLIPGWGPLAATAVGGIQGVGDYVRSRNRSRKAARAPAQLSQAEIERQRDERNRQLPPKKRGGKVVVSLVQGRTTKTKRKKKNRSQRRRSRQARGGTASTLDPRPGMQVVTIPT